MINANTRCSESFAKHFAKHQLGNCSDNCAYKINRKTTQLFLKNLKPTITLKHRTEVETIEVEQSISDIQFNDKGNLVASALWNSDKADIWDWSKRKAVTIFESGRDRVAYSRRQIRWVPGCENLVVISGGRQRTIRLMDINTNSSRVLEKHSDVLNLFRTYFKLAVTENLPFTLLAGSGEGEVLNVDVRTSEFTELLRLVDDFRNMYEITSMDINPVKFFEFCIGSAEDVRLYDCRNLSSPVCRLNTKTGHIYDFWHGGLNAKYSHDGSEILVSNVAGAVYLYNAYDSQPKKIFMDLSSKKRNHPVYLRYAYHHAHYVGPKSEFIAAIITMYTKKCKKYLYIWDKETEKLINVISNINSSCGIATHPHMPILAMNLDEIGIQIWQ